MSWRPPHIQQKIDALKKLEKKENTKPSESADTDSKKKVDSEKTSDPDSKEVRKDPLPVNESPETSISKDIQERFVILFKKNAKSKWRLFPRLFHDSDAAEKAVKIAEKFIKIKVLEVDLPE